MFQSTRRAVQARFLPALVRRTRLFVCFFLRASRVRAEGRWEPEKAGCAAGRRSEPRRSTPCERWESLWPCPQTRRQGGLDGCRGRATNATVHVDGARRALFALSPIIVPRYCARVLPTRMPISPSGGTDSLVGGISPCAHPVVQMRPRFSALRA
ncbi:hypothetical protein BD414DRAFT_51772 [Trametes punicea]|nr:hypothetical protein BD414DRAFT_51772 [Trametes punicea]